VRHVVLSAALLVLSLAAAPAVRTLTPSVFADDKNDKKKKEEEQKRREREKAKREKTLKDIGGDFGAKSVSLLLNRVPKGGKITLTLGGNDDSYSVTQARGVLDTYFDKFETLSVDFVKAEGSVGTFTLKVRKKGEDTEKVRKLYVTIGDPDADGNLPLLKLVVDAA
jgi:hypothetical protein